ncbi:MAG TPA: hypothetical protein VGE09_11490 [Pseudoxanthomonas sp.]
MRGSERSQRGFVLAVTLWLLAGIGVAVGLMMLWARSQVEHARLDSERLQDDVAALETRDTLLYIAATREFTLAGLPVEPLSADTVAMRKLDEFGGVMRDPVGGELRLDGTRYRGRGASFFAIQDEAGLFSLRRPTAGGLDRFLQVEGVEKGKIPRLRDTLLDYIDGDDLNHLQGAERTDYERERRPPPPNRGLLLSSELARVMDWDGLPPAQLGRIIEHASAFYVGAINLNTTPAELLPLWIPNCPEACELLLKRRQERPFRNGIEAEALTLGKLPGDSAIDYRTVAEGILRIDVWGRTGRGQRYHVRLTPSADQRGPWTILAAYPVQRPADDRDAETTQSPLLAGP